MHVQCYIRCTDTGAEGEHAGTMLYKVYRYRSRRRTCMYNAIQDVQIQEQKENMQVQCYIRCTDTGPEGEHAGTMLYKMYGYRSRRRTCMYNAI